MSAARISGLSSSALPDPKITSLPRLLGLLRRRSSRAGRVVFTNGVFDILHAGHARYLRAARKLGDLLVVGLNSDRSARRLKGPGRPIIPASDRAELLAALDCVDHVVVFGDPNPARLIAAIRPAVLVKGADWKRGDIVGRATMIETGGRVARIRLAKGRSTTRIIERILSRGRRAAGKRLP
jgi:rfaE bifunctional protein nucleotidyltransferase chain/domain